ncbi:Doubtful CDS [Staphylococcus agnetis]|nr:Doubtful CDS [Staphylococcus agnetis]
MNHQFLKNLNIYFHYLPLVGLLISIFLFLLYFVIFKVIAHPFVVSAYCLLPLVVFSIMSLFYKWLIHRFSK